MPSSGCLSHCLNCTEEEEWELHVTIYLGKWTRSWWLLAVHPVWKHAVAIFLRSEQMICCFPCWWCSVFGLPYLTIPLMYLDGIPHICFQVWFCRRSACANIRCMMGWRTRTLKNCLSPRIQALREIKLHRRQNLFHNNFYLKVDKCWSKEVVRPL